MAIEHPRLRNVEAVPVPGRAGRLIALRDPSGLSDQTVVITPDLFFLLTLFDGEHSLREIQVAYTRRFGDLLLSSRLNEIIEQLDASLLLESDRLEAHRREIEAEFRASAVRAAAHAGSAYPADPGLLRDQLDQYLRAAQVDGAAPGEKPVRGLVAPHIDFARGGLCYGWAYRQLAGAAPADTYVILGTDHGAAESPFIATRKGYATPLGTAQTDGELLDALAARCPFDLFAGEFAHRKEHSIEFQVVWLRHVVGEVRILPVLCGAFHRRDGEVVDPEGVPAAGEFARALRDAVAALGRRICVVAGADLSHVGPRFGDPQPAVPGRLRVIEAQDRALLQPAAAMDRARFAAALRGDHDARHVCGFPAIYALLALLEARDRSTEAPGLRSLGEGGAAKVEGALLKYDQAADHQTQSVVTFASLVYA